MYVRVSSHEHRFVISTEGPVLWSLFLFETRGPQTRFSPVRQDPVEVFTFELIRHLRDRLEPGKTPKTWKSENPKKCIILGKYPVYRGVKRFQVKCLALHGTSRHMLNLIRKPRENKFRFPQIFSRIISFSWTQNWNQVFSEYLEISERYDLFNC